MAQEFLLQQLNCYTLSGLSLTKENGITKTFFFYAVAYCCDVPEVREMSCIRHGTRVQGSCVSCLVSLSNIPHLRSGQERSVFETMEVQNIVTGIVA